MSTEEIYNRTEIVIGKENLVKIKKANVCICGIGGVGSFVMEALARIGIGNITVIDKDAIDVTNINRQLIATTKNLGESKVEEAKKRIQAINPQINVSAIQTYIDGNNIEKYITPVFDYVIDAIDSVESKIMLIKKCKNLNIKIISSMGMANRVDPLAIKVADISKTEMCPLAKIMRKRLKEEKISKVKVVYSTENPVKNTLGVLGSVSYVPSVAGLVIASEVIKDILKEV